MLGDKELLRQLIAKLAKNRVLSDLTTDKPPLKPDETPNGYTIIPLGEEPTQPYIAKTQKGNKGKRAP